MWGENWGDMIWGGAGVPVAMVPISAWALLILGFVLGITAVLARNSHLARMFPFTFFLLVPFVAVVAVNLPHTFSNGTVADANQVNENFSAVKDGLGGFTISGSGPNSIPIPNNIIEEYCEDADGCEMIISRTDVTIPNRPVVARGRLIAEYVSQGGLRNIYAENTIASGVQTRGGLDGDNNFDSYLSPTSSFTVCTVRDYAVVDGNPLQDINVDLHFYPAFSSVTCNLTIRD